MAAGEKLLILLKAPIRGAVKTRLAEEVGPDVALAIYRELLSSVLAEMSLLKDVELHYSPAAEQQAVSSLLRPGWALHLQPEGDLGLRMHHAFMDAFNQGCQRLVMIGTDCPEVTLPDIHAAWTALLSHDLVIGPATDGGYWLIGLRQSQPQLFKDMAWSTKTVLNDTLARAGQLGLRYQLLRPLSDVDTKADWEAYQFRRRPEVLE